MASLIGLFQRGGAYYIRVILPANHPLRSRYRSGKVIQTLGSCSHKEAVLKGTAKRAEILCGFKLIESEPAGPISAIAPTATKYSLTSDLTLRDVFDRWAKAERRTADTLAACERALKLYEEHTGNPSLERLTRAEGDAFRAKLQELPTSAKTARDRLNWVKGLLKYAAQDLELIPKNTWEGLEIKVSKTTSWQPWSDAQLRELPI